MKAITPTAADGSSLCAECGICCGWAIFTDVALRADEVAWASSKRLPLFPRGDRMFFPTPCSVLEVRAEARVCGDYAHRPAACRQFECKVLSRYKRGELSRAEATGLVARGRALIATVEERLGATGGGDIFEKFAGLSKTFVPESFAGRSSLYAEALLDVAVLRTFIAREFREPEERRVAAETDAESLTSKAKAPET
jgi:hypothetical protein